MLDILKSFFLHLVYMSNSVVKAANHDRSQDVHHQSGDEHCKNPFVVEHVEPGHTVVLESLWRVVLVGHVELVIPVNQIAPDEFRLGELPLKSLDGIADHIWHHEIGVLEVVNLLQSITDAP